MYRRACTSAVDEQDIEQAVAGVRDRAKSGDANAAKLFFAIVSTMAQEPTERAQVTVDVVLRALPAEFREAVRAELAALLSAGGGSGGGGASGR